VLQNGEWKQIAEVTSIGANKLIRLPQNITASKLRLRITASPVCIALSDFGLFKEPSHLSAPVISRNHEGMVNISTEAPVSAIHFTMDGSEPDSNSPLFTGSFSFKQSGTIKAIAFESGKAGEKSIKVFGINKTGWTVKADTSIRAGKNAMRAIDDDSRTVYNTITVKPESVFQPQTITVDMGNEVTIKGFTYLPRQDKRSEGIVDRYTYEISLDEVNWLPAAEGEFSNIISNPIEQTVIFKAPQKARYFRFTAMHVTSGNGVTIAELGVF
jgi:alpha-L-fucosidase